MLRILCVLSLTLTACASSSSDAPASTPVPQQSEQIPMKASSTPVPATERAPAPLSQGQSFSNWKQDFIARAIAKGYDETLVNTVIGNAKIKPKAIKSDKNQPESTKPVWSYVDSAASAVRVKQGRAKLTGHETLFDALETRYGVDRHILTSIWGLESAYGKIIGSDNIVDSMATLAFEGRRQEFFEGQLYAVLDLLARGEVRQDQLFGSWAGGMGMTQFIPTTFRDYAVDYDENGNKDLWTDPGDAMASTASYLSRFGWRRTEPVLTEVILPQGFDYALSDGTKRTISGWAGMGIRPVSGQKWSDDSLFLEAKLLILAGADGPTFLTFKNFDVIKKYNNSTSYALGITVLAEGFQDRQTITRDWPRADKPLSFSDKKALQAALTRQGFDTKGIDGRLGPNSFRAIRAWQKFNGYPADGYVEQKLLKVILGK